MTLPSLADIAAAPRRQMAWTTDNGVAGLPNIWSVTFNGPWEDASGYIPFDATASTSGVSPTSYQYRAPSGPYQTYYALDQAMIISAVRHFGEIDDGSRVAFADLLWITPKYTSTSPQTVDSFTLPARDRNGSTNGEGCIIGVFTEGSGAQITVSYTNSAGTSGRTGTTASGLAPGGPYTVDLQAGDTGVRSIQTVTSTLTSEYRVCIFRRLTTYQHHAVINNLSGVYPEARTGRFSTITRVQSGSLIFPLYGFNGGARKTNTVLDLAVI